jgi:thiol-disulfide isomerase/thioredoxin
LPTGTWSAWLDSPGGRLRFELEVRRTNETSSALQAWLINGEERIAVPRVAWSDNRLQLGIDHYDAEIAADRAADGRALDGTYRKRRGADRWVQMKFHGRLPVESGFVADPVAADAAARARVNGRWAVQFEKDRHPAVGQFEARSDGSARGTFLTTLGDYRFLAGQWAGDRLELSCFDGAHAFLFVAELRDDDRLHGDFWSAENWHETWVASRNASAELPDAFGLTRWRGTGDQSPWEQLGDLVFFGLDGQRRSVQASADPGRAHLVVLLGSWCPNCHDEAAYLAELDRRYRDSGLSILGLAFEHGGSLERDRQQVARFAERFGLRFPLLIAGVSDKQKAAQAVPLLDQVVAYPTTLFFAADGAVLAIHTGFSGPATGDAHLELRRRFEGLIEKLLSN